ncbi:MAG: MarR family transcriptional regulator [Deltaproteobacteria bacterium]|nr:MarR family transcriptional regulator [Deltaproteobacteria bacterium]
MSEKKLEIAVTEFIQAIGLLVRRTRAAAASHELSWTESAVLWRLAQEGPATTADLARAEAMKPQSMGAAVATLEKKGLVGRKPHPTDGRQVNVGLTAKGADLWKNAGDAKLAWLVRVISQLDEQERETLFAAGEIIRKMVDK